MGAMTADQLQDLIKNTTIPLIKDVVGKEVADVVKAAIAEQAQALKQQAGARPPYIAGLTDDAGVQQRHGRNEMLEKGILFARYVRCLAAARNDKERAVKVAKGWGYTDVADGLERSNEKAMSAGDPLAGGFLVPIEFSTDVIELLRASAVVRSLNPVTMPMNTGSVKVPKITSGTTASYIGENTNVTKSEVGTGQVTMTFKKLAALVPISNDLLRYSAPSADGIVRDDAVRAMAAREDLAFIRNDGTSGTPKGLKHWIDPANRFDANGTVNLANVTSDLGSAMQRIMDANITLIIQQGATGGVDARPGWIFPTRVWKYLTTVQTGTGQYAFRDEMLRGTLWGFPYRVTTQCENSTVYFGCFAHAVIGEALGLMVDASQDAAYHDGSNVIAAFSQDQTVIRVIAEHDFVLRHDKAFSLIETVTWGA